MTFVIKDDGKFYPQILLEEAWRKYGILQDSGIGAYQEMRKKKQSQFLLIKLGKGRSDKNDFSTRGCYMIWEY